MTKHQKSKLSSAAIFLAAVLCVSSVHAEFDYKEHLDKIDFLTEYYFIQDMHVYFGHKNDSLHVAYLLSGYSELEAMFVSYGDILHFGGIYGNYLGMGRQNEAILFNPRAAHYTLTPFFEFRRRGIFYQTGLDHRCFHKVDRLPIPTSPYWNQIYLKASSANYRFQQMRKNYLLSDRYGYLDRLRWSAWAGYFIWKWGDMDPSILGGGHTWSSTVGVDLGYSFYKTKSWVFSGQHKLSMFNDTTGAGYWAGLIGLDADIYNRKHTLGFFINYNYEFPRDMPFYFNKDKMWSWGFRFRY